MQVEQQTNRLMPGMPGNSSLSQPLNYTTLNDAELMLLVAYHNAEALTVIYDRYGGIIYALALKMLHQPTRAEEAVQEVFIKLWRKPQRYEASRGAFINWVLGVTHNQVVDQIIKERRHQTHVVCISCPDTQTRQTLQDHIADQSPDLGEQVWLETRRKLMRGLILRLPTAQREVIELAYFGGFSQTEIADHLRAPLGTVKTRTQLALKKLRAMLGEATNQGIQL
jgi:RNA polymerase sigma-70 factor (ECF subfamily)